MTETIDWLAQQAKLSPQKIALIQDNQQWRYAELNTWVARLAGQLAAAGIQKGQHVAVLLPNRAEYVCLIHALARLGAVLVPLNTRLTIPELRGQIQEADCSWLICGQETEPVAGALAAEQRRILSIDDPLEHTPLVQPLPACSSLAADQWQSRPLDLSALQGLLYTSGTTGQPKGALLTFNNHLWSATASAFRLGLDPADRWLLCMPLYHVGGLAIILRSCLYGTTVVLQRGFDPAAVAQALETQAITLISLVPTMLHRLLETHPAALSRPTLRCILLGGAATPPALLDRCLALNLPVAPTYGLTEAASQVATAAPSDLSERQAGSVGKPLLFTTIRIIDEAGQDLPAGAAGEIVVKGPTVMQGYYRQPAATARTLRGDELYTGDLGYLDETGSLWVLQRRVDLIVSGGENVYPVEVEQILRTHPHVEDACVVGLEDIEWGQRVAAAVVLRPGSGLTEPELAAFCRERLAGYKQPRLIHFVPTLPQTTSGKVQREQVRAMLVDM